MLSVMAAVFAPPRPQKHGSRGQFSLLLTYQHQKLTALLMRQALSELGS